MLSQVPLGPEAKLVSEYPDDTGQSVLDCSLILGDTSTHLTYEP